MVTEKTYGSVYDDNDDDDGVLVVDVDECLKCFDSYDHCHSYYLSQSLKKRKNPNVSNKENPLLHRYNLKCFITILFHKIYEH